MSELKPRRMDAYYYGFATTGVGVIDKVLGAVACAGKAHHHTEDWEDGCDGCSPYDDHTGDSPVAWIQNAAQEAADAFDALEAENKALREELRNALQFVEQYSHVWNDHSKVKHPASIVNNARALLAKEGER